MITKTRAITTLPYSNYDSLDNELFKTEFIL